MFFILSKILSFLLSPFNWCILLLLVRWRVKTSKYKKILLRTTIGVFIVFSNTFLFQIVISSWEYPSQSVKALSKNSSSIVVLGGMSSYDASKDRIYFNAAVDRLLQALPIHINNRERKIIISGGSAELYFEERPEAEYLKAYLIDIGINQGDILFEKKSRNTYENALYAAQLCDSISMNKEIVLITSAFHMKRAQACFEKQGFIVTPFSAQILTNHQKLKPADYFIPSLYTLQQWPIVIKEWIGILVYNMKGYI